MNATVELLKDCITRLQHDIKLYEWEIQFLHTQNGKVDSTLLDVQIYHFKLLQNACKSSIEHVENEISELAP